MEPRSTRPSTLRWRATKPPVQRRVNCPARNGTSSWSTIFTTESPEKPPTLPPSSAAASSGVTTMPASEENDPAQIAAGTLPRAIEVNAIEDWMVEGTRVQNSSPWYRGSVRNTGTRPRVARPSSGKTMKVQARTVTWSRQCLRPSSASRVDRRAP